MATGTPRDIDSLPSLPRQAEFGGFSSLAWVLRDDGMLVESADVRAGMRVLPGPYALELPRADAARGGWATVRCVVITRGHTYQWEVNGVGVTARQLYVAGDGVREPCGHLTPRGGSVRHGMHEGGPYMCNGAVNFVLERADGTRAPAVELFTSGIQCETPRPGLTAMTLGGGMGDSYATSEQIIDDLRRLPGWEQGYIELRGVPVPARPAPGED